MIAFTSRFIQPCRTQIMSLLCSYVVECNRLLSLHFVLSLSRPSTHQFTTLCISVRINLRRRIQKSVHTSKIVISNDINFILLRYRPVLPSAMSVVNGNAIRFSEINNIYFS
jgi:hypothetical protein